MEDASPFHHQYSNHFGHLLEASSLVDKLRIATPTVRRVEDASPFHHQYSNHFGHLLEASSLVDKLRIVTPYSP
ncbi:hypothetical protein ACVTMO_14350 [Pseudomonas segetis]